jgi:hypothetical protein
MLTAIARVTNNLIGTGYFIPINVVLSFCGTIRVVLPAEIRACETSECKAYLDIQALLIRERHSKRWDVENIIPLPVSSETSVDIIGIKAYNLRSDYCKIQRHPKYAVGEAVFKYDLDLFYLEVERYKTYQIKDLSTVLSHKLDHIPPPEARLISSCQIEVLDFMAPDSISLSVYDWSLPRNTHICNSVR